MNQLIDQIIEERKDCLENICARKDEEKTAEELEEKKACDIRMKAMERIGETKKRIANPEDESPKMKKRRTGNDTLAFMEQRSEERKKEREEEMNMRQKDLEVRNKQNEATSTAMLEMMTLMQQQMAAQQQQAQRLYETQQQQHQQNLLLFISMIEKLNKN